ncbi:hypothetical protein R5R35_002270 [Gryllus longicercus]|uniref:Uncharacterized protein n=1 Tax=Gryllus longicercus TaxID=2509291 RepID=A0AAN9W860_9ORTH
MVYNVTCSEAMGFQGFVYAAIATDQRCRSTESLEKYAKTCHRQYRRRMLSSAVSELRRMLYPKKINSRLARATGGGKLEERKKKKQKKTRKGKKKAVSVEMECATAERLCVPTHGANVKWC